VDELGYKVLDRGGAELLFQVLTERETGTTSYRLAHAPQEARRQLTTTSGAEVTGFMRQPGTYFQNA
jgi:hypothetical protein